MTEKPQRSRRRRLIRWGLVILLALSPRLFLELHIVRGTSMWPSFNRDSETEWLIVLKSWVAADPGVWDVVVVEDPENEDRSVLKRVCALPGQRPRIADGDLRILSEDLEKEFFVPRSLDQILAVRVPVTSLDELRYRQRGRKGQIVDAFGRPFVVPEAGRAALASERGSLLVEPAETGTALLRLPEAAFVDDHRSARGRPVAGSEVVRDLIISFELQELPVGAELVFRHELDTGLDEGLSLRVEEDELALFSWGPGAEQASSRIPRSRPLTFRLLLVDDRRVLQVRELDSEWEFRTLSERPRDLPHGTPFSHLKLFLSGASVIFTRLDIDRDLHYTPAPDGEAAGIAEGRRVRPGRRFLLGDNSPASRDGRHWRADAPSEPVGRPLLVIWPWSAARILD